MEVFDEVDQEYAEVLPELLTKHLISIEKNTILPLFPSDHAKAWHTACFISFVQFSLVSL